MRLALLATLLLAAAGCAGPAEPAATLTGTNGTDAGGAQTTDPATGTGTGTSGPGRPGTPESRPARPPPLYINGTLTAAGGCPVEAYPMLPPQAPGDTQAVPQDAWDRDYEPPTFQPASSSPGAACVLWLDGAGTVLASSLGGDGGTVPQGAVNVLVRSNLAAQANYSIVVD